MTLIFVYKEPVKQSPEDGSILPQDVYIATDRMVSDDVENRLMKSTKYRSYDDGKFVFTSCGSWRLNQLVSYALDDITTKYELSLEKDEMAFIVKEVIPAIQSALEMAGYNIAISKPDDYGLNMNAVLITPSRRIFSIDNELSVCEYEEGIWIRGSGEIAAKVSWKILSDLGWALTELDTVQNRIYKLFEYVAEVEPTVSAEVDLVVLDGVR